MTLTRKHMYAIKLLDENNYIYFTFIAGNKNMGYVFEVYKYVSNTIEYDNIEYISKQKPLFPERYIIAYVQESDKNILTKVGKIAIDYKSRNINIFERSCSLYSSIKSLNSILELPDNHTEDDYYVSIIKAAKEGKKVYAKNWDIIQYSVSSTGKFDYVNEYRKIGKLDEKYYNCMIFGTVYLIEDIMEYFRNDIDRITAEMIIYR